MQPPGMVGYYDLDAEIVVSNHDLDAQRYSSGGDQAKRGGSDCYCSSSSS